MSERTMPSSDDKRYVPHFRYGTSLACMILAVLLLWSGIGELLGIRRQLDIATRTMATVVDVHESKFAQPPEYIAEVRFTDTHGHERTAKFKSGKYHYDHMIGARIPVLYTIDDQGRIQVIQEGLSIWETGIAMCLIGIVAGIVGVTFFLILRDSTIEKMLARRW